MDRYPALPAAALVLLGLAIVPGGVAAQEPQLIDVKSGGVLDILAETGLRLEGITGTISLRVARQGELRFQCRSLDSRREERDVALWLDHKTLVFAMPQDAEPERLLLEIGVSPQLAIDLEIHDSILKLQGLRSDVSVVGSELQLDGRGLVGDVELKLDRSSVTIDGAQGLELDGSNLEVRLQRVSGFLSLTLEDSAALLEQIEGSAELDLTETELQANGIVGRLGVAASGGSLELSGVENGARIELSETPLVLAESSGELRIETDSDVTFRDLKGPLHLDGYGGVVRGAGSSALVEVSTSGAEVSLDGIVGTTIVTGDRLKVFVKNTRGELTIRATSSDVTVENAQGPTTIETDFGDVVVLKALKELTVVSSDGNVRATELRGPVQVTANGPEVLVAWDAMWREKDARVENRAGSVQLVLPPRAGGRVELQSRYGRVESNVEEIHVSEDGKSASGTLRRVSKPKISVICDGDIVLNGPATTAP